ncbi:hypothetical protein U1Q18_044673 [Sarracenia purpurea var. burkii]
MRRGISESTWGSMTGQRREYWKCPGCRPKSKLKQNPKKRRQSDSQDGSNLEEAEMETITLTQFEVLLSEQLNKHVKSISDAVTSMSNAIENCCKRVVAVKTDVSKLLADNSALRSQLDGLEQYGRRNNVVLKNILIKRNKVFENLVIRIGNAIGCELAVDNLDAGHRLPTRCRDQIPPLLIKFCSRLKKQQFLEKWREAKPTQAIIGGEPSVRLYADSHLTQQTAQLLKSA